MSRLAAIRLVVLMTLVVSDMGSTIVLAKTTNDEGEIGKAAGDHMYLDLEGTRTHQSSELIAERLKESGNGVNERIGQICSTEDTPEDDYCLMDTPFTEDELQRIAAGDNTTLMSHIKSEYKDHLDTDTFTAITTGVRAYRSDLLDESQTDVHYAEGVGLIGLYSDSDDSGVDEGGFDLLSDISQVDGTISGHAPTYAGPKNTADQDFTRLISGNGGSAGAGVSAVWGMSPVTPSASITRAPGVPRLDPWLLRDVTSQKSSGTNIGSLLGGASPTSALGGSLTSWFDTPSCSGPACTDTVNQHNDSLLDSSTAGTPTIEGYLTKASKVQNGIVGRDLVQSRMTKNYIEDPRRGNSKGTGKEDFASMTNVGPMVTTRPADVANIPKDGNAQATLDDEYKHLKRQVLVDTFRAHGMDYDTQNTFTSDCQDMGIGQVAHLSTQEAGAKAYPADCPTNGGTRTEYADLQMTRLRDDYQDTMSRYMGQKSWYASTRRQSIDQLSWVLDRTASHPDTP